MGRVTGMSTGRGSSSMFLPSRLVMRTPGIRIERGRHPVVEAETPTPERTLRKHAPRRTAAADPSPALALLLRCGSPKELLKGGPRRISPFFIPSAIINLAAGQVSIRFGAKGPNLATCTACTAASRALAWPRWWSSCMILPSETR